MNSTPNGPITTFSPRPTIFNGILGAPRLAEPTRLDEFRREARQVDGRAQVRPKLHQGTDVILMRVGDDDPDQILFRLFDEFEIGMMRSTPGKSSPAKPTPRSTISHRRAFTGP